MAFNIQEYKQQLQVFPEITFEEYQQITDLQVRRDIAKKNKIIQTDAYNRTMTDLRGERGMRRETFTLSFRRSPNKKFRKALGKRIRELRLLEKMSQSQFGFEVGIHRDQVGRIERGVQSPSVDSLEAMASVFDMSLKELFDFEY